MAISTNIYKYETNPAWWDKADPFADPLKPAAAQEAYQRLREQYPHYYTQYPPPVPVPTPEPELERGRVGDILSRVVARNGETFIRYIGDGWSERFEFNNHSNKTLLVTVTVIEPERG